MEPRKHDDFIGASSFLHCLSMNERKLSTEDLAPETRVAAFDTQNCYYYSMRSKECFELLANFLSALLRYIAQYLATDDCIKSPMVLGISQVTVYKSNIVDRIIVRDGVTAHPLGI